MDQSTLVAEKDIMEALELVQDPEISTVSVVDLGMIEDVEIHDSHVSITMLPTFLGCPALEIIKKNVVEQIESVAGVKAVEVSFKTSPPWTSDRITEKGQQGLKAFGIAPPPKHFTEDGSWHVDCPYCGSTYVTLDNIFGPTACRSILYCKSCKNPFEAMKPISNLM
ncbi:MULTISPECIES: 1,2-phenylacetyl-CoA epoxidase subunit PaaD [Cytobacillus]|uniref:Phenylacetate-CoA oxygenase subunit PaaJ n=1 Tax=Cytobacillus stercorigallinarum TaxID=2762240 RepID=A0ABR8QS94_9BACI|nr:1,2-phenylacetyl-CoA epoxidase subunit PaaD [Cytobacillus stercorigallinarum]MBD7938394.1 phenylacetate-CoA oxygenase subunit PaaJ [Cytobacillus stercorigallinarum]